MEDWRMIAIIDEKSVQFGYIRTRHGGPWQLWFNTSSIGRRSTANNTISGGCRKYTGAVRCVLRPSYCARHLTVEGEDVQVPSQTTGSVWLGPGPPGTRKDTATCAIDARRVVKRRCPETTFLTCYYALRSFPSSTYEMHEDGARVS